MYRAKLPGNWVQVQILEDASSRPPETPVVLRNLHSNKLTCVSCVCSSLRTMGRLAAVLAFTPTWCSPELTRTQRDAGVLCPSTVLKAGNLTFPFSFARGPSGVSFLISAGQGPFKPRCLPQSGVLHTFLFLQPQPQGCHPG